MSIRRPWLGVLFCGTILFGQTHGDAELQRLMSEAPRVLPPHEAKPVTKAVDSLGPKVSNSLRDQLAEIRQPADGARSVSEDTLLPVMLTASSDAVTERVVGQVKNAGGKSVHSDARVILARVPASAIQTLAASKDVDYLTLQPTLQERYQSKSDPTEADALGLMQLGKLHENGFTGQGVKVGIVDFGFQGYARLQQKGLVPAPTQVRVFGEEEGHSIENGDEHGAACAEIIHAAAPGARLYLAMIDSSWSAWSDAAAWMKEEGVQIVSFSGGSVASELRGGDPLSRVVDKQVREDGRLWVISAGNHGDLHWLLSAQKADSEGWLQFGAVGEVLFPIRTGEVEEQANKRSYGLTVTVNWDDWSGSGNQSGQDIDACIFMIPSVGEKPREIQCSEERQSENSGAPPVEIIRLKGEGYKDKVLYLALKKVKLTHPVRVHIFVNTDTAALPVSSAGSISSPATSRLALAVGAYDVQSKSLAGYSSMGPTDDGRIKPDVIAPSGAYSAAYGHVFDGTSSSCPYVAGFAAVYAGMFPSLKGEKLRSGVIQAVTPVGQPSPNNQYGYGFVTATALLKNRAPASDAEKPAIPMVDGVPRVWGGPAPAALLEKLRTMPASTWKGAARLVTGRDSYKVGDGLKFGVRVDRDSSYLLFYRAADGEFLFLLPEEGDVTLLRAGERYIIPDSDRTLPVKASMVGEPELLLIVAPQPVDWRHWSDPDAVSAVAIARFRVTP